MARYIDADAVIAKIKAEHCDKCNHNERCFYCDFDKALMLLEEADDADVEEVVRCKDCKFYFPPFCNRPKNKPCQTHAIMPNDFCSYGERKEK